MASPRRRGLIIRLRNAADKLVREAELARHRLEIENSHKSDMMLTASAMRSTADFLEKLP